MTCSSESGYETIDLSETDLAIISALRRSIRTLLTAVAVAARSLIHGLLQRICSHTSAQWIALACPTDRTQGPQAAATPPIANAQRTPLSFLSHISLRSPQAIFVSELRYCCRACEGLDGSRLMTPS